MLSSTVCFVRIQLMDSNFGCCCLAVVTHQKRAHLVATGHDRTNLRLQQLRYERQQVCSEELCIQAHNERTKRAFPRDQTQHLQSKDIQFRQFGRKDPVACQIRSTCSRTDWYKPSCMMVVSFELLTGILTLPKSSDNDSARTAVACCSVWPAFAITAQRAEIPTSEPFN